MSFSDDEDSSSDDASSITSELIQCSNPACGVEFATSSEGCSVARRMCSKCNNDLADLSREYMESDTEESSATSSSGSKINNESSKIGAIALGQNDNSGAGKDHDTNDGKQQGNEESVDGEYENDTSLQNQPASVHSDSILALFAKKEVTVSFYICDRSVTVLHKRFKSDSLRRSCIRCYVDLELDGRVKDMLNFYLLGAIYNTHCNTVHHTHVALRHKKTGSLWLMGAILRTKCNKPRYDMVLYNPVEDYCTIRCDVSRVMPEYVRLYDQDFCHNTLLSKTADYLAANYEWDGTGQNKDELGGLINVGEDYTPFVVDPEPTNVRNRTRSARIVHETSLNTAPAQRKSRQAANAKKKKNAAIAATKKLKPPAKKAKNDAKIQSKPLTFIIEDEEPELEVQLSQRDIDSAVAKEQAAHAKEMKAMQTLIDKLHKKLDTNTSVESKPQPLPLSPHHPAIPEAMPKATMPLPASTQITNHAVCPPTLQSSSLVAYQLAYHYREAQDRAERRARETVRRAERDAEERMHEVERERDLISFLAANGHYIPRQPY